MKANTFSEIEHLKKILSESIHFLLYHDHIVSRHLITKLFRNNQHIHDILKKELIKTLLSILYRDQHLHPKVYQYQLLFFTKGS